MSTTYGTIETEVLNNLGRTDDNSKLLVRTAFKGVQELLANSQQWDDLATVITATFESGIADYEEATWLLNEDTKIFNIVVQDSTRRYPPMKFLTTQRWDELLASVSHTVTGRPECWNRWAGVISVHPVPDTDYTARVRAYTQPVPVVDETTVLSWKNKDGMLIAATTALAWLSLEEDTMAKNYLNLAKYLMGQAGADEVSILNFSTAIHDYKNQGYAKSSDTWNDPFNKGGR